jgi:Transglutaminase-like superfamily
MKTLKIRAISAKNLPFLLLFLFLSNCTNPTIPGGNSGNSGETIEPDEPISQPILASPICDAAKQVLVTGATIGAKISIFKNETVIGSATATAEEMLVPLNQSLLKGDKLAVRQEKGIQKSNISAIIEVAAGAPTTGNILGGESFFKPENGEIAIDAPVFLRGKMPVQIVVNSCCAQKLSIEIKDPKGKLLTTILPAINVTGSFSISWDWKMLNGQPVLGGISVGKYMAIIKTACEPKPIELPFYVIFDPAEFGAPSRFAFNETNVWFGAHTNASRALLYHLHPDDARIFGMTIAACSGETDQIRAAQKIVDAEENKFGYSLNYHTNDALDLLARFTETQCADDANFLTAMFRSVGIAARTATADAALETGDANWTFDTWTEFMAKKTANLAAEWLIFHPHEYPDMSPENRQIFGKTRGVATKKFNDLMIVADENWKINDASDSQVDVSFERSDCNEPKQNLVKKSWLEEVSDKGYWGATFFDCVDLSVRDVASRAKMDLNLGNVGFGRSLVGSVVLPPGNPFSKAGIAPPSLQIVGDFPESKKFPDTIFSSKTMNFSRSAGLQTSKFDLNLPPTAPAGMALWVVSVSGKKVISAQPIFIESALKVSITLSQNFRKNTDQTIEAVITNLSKAIVNGVSVKISGSSDTQISGDLTQNIGKLNPSESRKLSWKIIALAPKEADEIRLLVNSADGGGASVGSYFSVK